MTVTSISAAAFVLLIVVSAQVAVPMVPVSMTMQTFAVLLAGAWLGPDRGTVAVLAYLALGAAGAPVFSEGGSGLDALMGATAGYLWSFPIAAALAGWAVHRDWLRPWPRGVAVLWALHLLILTLGAAWMSRLIGVEAAMRDGVLPFLVGAGFKSALVVAALALRDRIAPQIRSIRPG